MSDEIVLIYFSAFPSTHALGPAITVDRLATHLSRHAPVRILTLNYDCSTRKPLFRDAHTIVKSGNVTTEYLPYDVRRFSRMYAVLRASQRATALHCLFDYRMAIPALLIGTWARGRSARFLHFPHGIFLNAVYQQKHLKKLLFCFALETFGLSKKLTHVASAPLEAEDIQRCFRSRQKIVTLTHFGQPPINHAGLALTGKKPCDLRICFAGRVVQQKNLLGALDILKQIRVPCTFDIIGSTDDEIYYSKCKDAVATLPQYVSVNFLGSLPRDELMERFPTYHALFFPTGGENFGHAIIEALANALPVLISDRTPWSDVESRGAGWAFSLEFPERFVEVLEMLYRMGPEYSRSGAIKYAEDTASPPGLEQAVLALFQ